MNLSNITNEIEQIIAEALPDAREFPSHIVEAMNYAMTAGGKRIRPVFMFLTYSAVSDTNLKSEYILSEDELLKGFLAAIEMIHTHSLIHDDLPALDNDSVRRGRPTVHVQFDESTAILAGDALLNRAYETCNLAFDAGLDAVKDEDELSYRKAFQDSLRILADKTGINGMLGGQGLDVELSGQAMTDEQRDYINKKKTCALIEAPIMIGATLAGADGMVIDELERAGEMIGMAFQVEDDILDVIGDVEKLGKDVHQDQRNEKNTYVARYGIDAAREYVKEESGKAVDIILDSLPDNDYRALLIELINSLVYRES
ncbi:MAG: polyprenyl synthetase family protein [Eubacterium sp.]|nr:polyprenyl synthetase family protein [Eubacterium sp.]